MKKLLAITGLLAVFFTSCEVHPYADFTADFNRVQPFEEIRFTNISDQAVSFSWDFGDGYSSTEMNPRHTYTEEGTFQVSLRVVSKDNNVDVAYMTIEVYYTLLEISVVEWNQDEHVEFLIPDALVILYESLSDWENDVYSVADGYTDGHGIITFAGLEDRQYYVWAEKVYPEGDGYDNYQFYEQFLDDYITTPYLIPFELNPWIAWVDYYTVYPDKSIKQNRYKKYPNTKINSDARSFIKVDVTK
jgi:hypothetical protein